MKTANSPYIGARRCFFSALLGVLVLVGFGVSHESDAQSTTRNLKTGTGLPLAPNAPERYTVQRGDTLWDISKVFLSQPWYWPEIWYLNPQIENPHLIYPGDVLALDIVSGQPRLMVKERGPEAERVIAGGAERLSPQVRSEPLSAAITAIPYKVVAAFMGRPALLTSEQVKSAPYILSIRDRHLMGGSGDQVYARLLGGKGDGERFNILHVDEPLVDPDDEELLGYRALFVGTAEIIVPGDPAKLQIAESMREALLGDKLLPVDTSYKMDFVPHAPATNVKGIVIAVSGIELAGQYQVVAINRGSTHGLEAGHVLEIDQKGEMVVDHYSDGRTASPASSDVKKQRGKKIQLPDERVGVLMVFKSYSRISYGLIMETTHPVTVGDIVRNP